MFKFALNSDLDHFLRARVYVCVRSGSTQLGHALLNVEPSVGVGRQLGTGQFRLLEWVCRRA